MGWQPIETAPKDGTPIILGYIDRRGSVGARSAFWMGDVYSGRTKKPIGAWVCPIDRVLVDQQATHWMPLPTPPAAGDHDGE